MMLLMRLGVIALVGLSARPATGQDPEHRQQRESEDVHLRNDCRLAVQVLTRGEPSNKREWALDTIDRCDESGPPVLARMWREVAADSASLGHTIYRSVYMRDRRVYDVITGIARDRSVPALKRAAALHLLVRWARPGLSLQFRRFFRPDFMSREQHLSAFAGISHDTQYEGAEPLPATIKDDVIRLARDVAEDDPNYRLQAIAAEIVSWLSYPY
jgi:hypothetical protein